MIFKGYEMLCWYLTIVSSSLENENTILNVIFKDSKRTFQNNSNIILNSKVIEQIGPFSSNKIVFLGEYTIEDEYLALDLLNRCEGFKIKGFNDLDDPDTLFKYILQFKKMNLLQESSLIFKIIEYLIKRYGYIKDLNLFLSKNVFFCGCGKFSDLTVSRILHFLFEDTDCLLFLSTKFVFTDMDVEYGALKLSSNENKFQIVLSLKFLNEIFAKKTTKNPIFKIDKIQMNLKENTLVLIFLWFFSQLNQQTSITVAKIVGSGISSDELQTFLNIFNDSNYLNCIFSSISYLEFEGLKIEESFSRIIQKFSRLKHFTLQRCIITEKNYEILLRSILSIQDLICAEFDQNTILNNGSLEPPKIKTQLQAKLVDLCFNDSSLISTINHMYPGYLFTLSPFILKLSFYIGKVEDIEIFKIVRVYKKLADLLIIVNTSIIGTVDVLCSELNDIFMEMQIKSFSIVSLCGILKVSSLKFNRLLKCTTINFTGVIVDDFFGNTNIKYILSFENCLFTVLCIDWTKKRDSLIVLELNFCEYYPIKFEDFICSIISSHMGLMCISFDCFDLDLAKIKTNIVFYHCNWLELENFTRNNRKTKQVYTTFFIKYSFRKLKELILRNCPDFVDIILKLKVKSLEKVTLYRCINEKGLIFKERDNNLDFPCEIKYLKIFQMDTIKYHDINKIKRIRGLKNLKFQIYGSFTKDFSSVLTCLVGFDISICLTFW